METIDELQKQYSPVFLLLYESVLFISTSLHLNFKKRIWEILLKRHQLSKFYKKAQYLFCSVMIDKEKNIPRKYNDHYNITMQKVIIIRYARATVG